MQPLPCLYLSVILGIIGRFELVRKLDCFEPIREARKPSITGPPL
jgi:hypothetical protein